MESSAHVHTKFAYVVIGLYCSIFPDWQLPANQNRQRNFIQSNSNFRVINKTTVKPNGCKQTI